MLEHVFIPADEKCVNSQDAYVAVGTPLIGAKTIESRSLYNSAHYTCVRLNPLTVVEDGKEEEIVITLAEFPRIMRLGWALIIVSSQGKTIPGRVVIHESHNRWFSPKHTLTALSRAQHCSLVSFA